MKMDCTLGFINISADVGIIDLSVCMALLSQLLPIRRIWILLLSVIAVTFGSEPRKDATGNCGILVSVDNRMDHQRVNVVNPRCTVTSPTSATHCCD